MVALVNVWLALTTKQHCRAIALDWGTPDESPCVGSSLHLRLICHERRRPGYRCRHRCSATLVKHWYIRYRPHRTSDPKYTSRRLCCVCIVIPKSIWVVRAFSPQPTRTWIALSPLATRPTSRSSLYPPTKRARFLPCVHVSPMIFSSLCLTEELAKRSVMTDACGRRILTWKVMSECSSAASAVGGRCLRVSVCVWARTRALDMALDNGSTLRDARRDPVLRIDVCTYAVVQTVLQPTKDRSHVERCHRVVECVECRLSSANLFFVDAACNREERARNVDGHRCGHPSVEHGHPRRAHATLTATAAATPVQSTATPV